MVPGEADEECPVTGWPVTGAWWTETLLSTYSTHKDATQMGPTPGSIAL